MKMEMQTKMLKLFLSMMMMMVMINLSKKYFEQVWAILWNTFVANHFNKTLRFTDLAVTKSNSSHNLAKLEYFTNLDFPEIRGPIPLPIRYLLGAQVL